MPRVSVLLRTFPMNLQQRPPLNLVLMKSQVRPRRFSTSFEVRAIPELGPKIRFGFARRPACPLGKPSSAHLGASCSSPWARGHRCSPGSAPRAVAPGGCCWGPCRHRVWGAVGWTRVTAWPPKQLPSLGECWCFARGWGWSTVPRRGASVTAAAASLWRSWG